MGYKDEYEVARLHTEANYSAAQKPEFHMAPPLITKVDPLTGRRNKIKIPGWIALPLLRVLRHGKRVRGTSWDFFGRQEDRVAERAMIATYEADMRHVLRDLTKANIDAAVKIADWPDHVRGFGPLKLASWQWMQKQRPAMLAALAQSHLQQAAE